MHTSLEDRTILIWLFTFRFSTVPLYHTCHPGYSLQHLLDSCETKFLGRLGLIISTNSGLSSTYLENVNLFCTKIIANIHESWQCSKLPHARILLALTDMSVTTWRHEKKKKKIVLMHSDVVEVHDFKETVPAIRDSIDNLTRS
jgi:hypothetical protein